MPLQQRKSPRLLSVKKEKDTHVKRLRLRSPQKEQINYVDCPVCKLRIDGNQELVNDHIEYCLSQIESIPSPISEKKILSSDMVDILPNDHESPFGKQQYTDEKIAELSQKYPQRTEPLTLENLSPSELISIIKKQNQQIFKCHICLDHYDRPVVSISCWHVYCECCWAQTISAKRVCPQCNLIISPSDLRRIYL